MASKCFISSKRLLFSSNLTLSSQHAVLWVLFTQLTMIHSWSGTMTSFSLRQNSTNKACFLIFKFSDFPLLLCYLSSAFSGLCMEFLKGWGLFQNERFSLETLSERIHLTDTVPTCTCAHTHFPVQNPVE